MSEVVKEAMYVKSNAAGNNNKFWHIAIHEDCTVHVKNDRVGTSGQTQPVKTFSSIDSAESFYHKKCREKEGKSLVNPTASNHGHWKPEMFTVPCTEKYDKGCPVCDTLEGNKK